MKNQNSFSGRSVIVTGGSRGLGRGAAEHFLAAGADVIIAARNTPDSLPTSGGKVALFCQTDVRDPDSSQALIDFAVAETGRLDILINNAGGSPEVLAKDASPRFTSAIISMNLIAPAVLSQQAYLAICATAKRGSIVNIASVSAIRPSPGTAAYGAAKAGLVNLTRSLAQEWAPDVRVNVIIAGLAKTESAFDHYGGQEGIAKIEQRMPMQRMATPEDIAKACMYLCSDQADYISGASLEVHGGGEPPAFLSLHQDD
jgi:NAD(P)-dependent dehydrogenase (short-subunit alcohol dehydrogenase family)